MNVRRLLVVRNTSAGSAKPLGTDPNVVERSVAGARSTGRNGLVAGRLSTGCRSSAARMPLELRLVTAMAANIALSRPTGAFYEATSGRHCFAGDTLKTKLSSFGDVSVGSNSSSGSSALLPDGRSREFDKRPLHAVCDRSIYYALL